MANTGPSARIFRFESVTTMATSMIWSVSGSRPVISISTHTRLNSFGRTGSAGAAFNCVACDIIVFSFDVVPFSHRQRMYSHAFSVLFVGFLVITLIVRFWLGSRHIRHVLRHRDAVPPQFAEKIPLAAHQKAADYTIAKTKLGLTVLLVNTAALIGFTLLGGLQWLSNIILH